MEVAEKVAVECLDCFATLSLYLKDIFYIMVHLGLYISEATGQQCQISKRIGGNAVYEWKLVFGCHTTALFSRFRPLSDTSLAFRLATTTTLFSGLNIERHQGLARCLTYSHYRCPLDRSREGMSHRSQVEIEIRRVPRQLVYHPNVTTTRQKAVRFHP